MRSAISPALSRLVMWLLVLAAAIWTLQRLETTLTIFGLAFVIAYLLNSVVSTLEARYSMPRGRAIVLVYGLLIGAMVVGTAILIPIIKAQLHGMVLQLPTIPARMNTLVATLHDNWVARVPEAYQEQLQENLKSSAATAAHAATSLFTYVQHLLLGVVAAAFKVFTALVVSVFVLMAWQELGADFMALLPLHYRQEIRQLGYDLHKIFGGYLKAQITLSTVTGAITLVVLFLHSFVAGPNPYILVIACVTTLAFPIPVVNYLLPSAVAGVLGFVNRSDGGYALMLALLVYAVIFLIERTLAPRIMSEAVGVPPLFVLFGAFAGAELLGPVGALVGVPLAAMVKSIFVWFHGRFLAAREEEVVAPPRSSVALVDLSTVLSELEQLKLELARLREAPAAAPAAPAESPVTALAVAPVVAPVPAEVVAPVPVEVVPVAPVPAEVVPPVPAEVVAPVPAEVPAEKSPAAASVAPERADVEAEDESAE